MVLANQAVQLWLLHQATPEWKDQNTRHCIPWCMWNIQNVWWFQTIQTRDSKTAVFGGFKSKTNVLAWPVCAKRGHSVFSEMVRVDEHCEWIIDVLLAVCGAVFTHNNNHNNYNHNTNTPIITRPKLVRQIWVVDTQQVLKVEGFTSCMTWRSLRNSSDIMTYSFSNSDGLSGKGLTPMLAFKTKWNSLLILFISCFDEG